MSLTLQRLVKEFEEWATLALAPASVQAYRHQLKKFLVGRRKKQIHRLKPRDLTSWAKTWHEGQAVVRLFNWAVHEAGILRKNPFASVRLHHRAYRKRIMTPAEMVAITREASPAFRRYLIAVRETVARPQEIRNVRWEDVQSEDVETPILRALGDGKAVIVLHEFKDRDRRKESGLARTIVIKRRLGRMMLRIARGAEKLTGPIFLNTKNRPWTKDAVRLNIRRLRRRLGWSPDKNGENVVTYTFRHSQLTLLAARGVRDRVLADIATHRDVRTTQRYLHLCVAHMREAMDKLSNRWRRTTPCRNDG